ncbi:MAG TPA: hypothetical protein VEM14_07140, partial [Gemmatimonadaceae bacterium]|nr:hypothetical protein [Gemmatimonadaceae bacterium]
RWCFHSPVGSALALLRMRAACRAYRRRSAFDDYVRCMTASTILEPLAEGLALFAEFDTYPGNSRWMSQTLTATLIFFAPAVETDDKPLLLLEGLLQALRRDPLLLERKAGIYAPPADVFDPYLVGYLSVRSLWCQMAAACSELNDRDLFLSYLRSYLYDDRGMVLRILGSYPSEVHACGAIVNYLLSRIGELVSFEGLGERVELWIRSAENGHVDAASIGAKAADEQRAERIMELALVADVDDDKSETLATWMLMTLQERQVCVVASTAVDLKPQPTTDRLDVVVPGVSEPVSNVAADSIGDSRGGELVVVASSNGHAIVVLLRVDQNVTLLSSFGEFSESELVLAKRHVANRPVSASLHEEFRANLERSPVVTTVWAFVAKRVAPAMKELFGPLATLNAKECDWPQAFSELQGEGVFGLLEHDGELTRALAAIGLVNTFSTDVALVRMMGKVLGVDDTALERAMNLAPRHGLPLVAKKGESVIALV